MPPSTRRHPVLPPSASRAGSWSSRVQAVSYTHLDVYKRQEKLRAYALQDGGADTLDANLALGHAIDARQYRQSADILSLIHI